MIQRLLFITFVCLSVFAPLSPVLAERSAPGDYNGDDLSDLVVARSIAGGWNWFIRYSNGTESQPIPFGLANDQYTDSLYAGDFNGDGRFEPGVVRSGADGLLTWYSRRGDGTARSQQWGLVGDEQVTGYFDSDDVTDIAVVRNVGGLLYWFLARSSGTDKNLQQWGLQGDAVFSGDLNGDRKDDLIVARAISGGVTWFARTTTGIALTPIQWGLQSDTLLPPFDVNDDGVDDLVVVREIVGGLVAFIRLNNANGSALTTQIINFGLKGDVPFVGSYTRSDTGEFGVYRTSAGTVSTHFINAVNSGLSVLPFGLAGDALVRPDGMGVGDESTDEPEDSGIDSVCDSIRGSYSGFLWKPSSDHSGGSREGNPLVIFKSGGPRDTCLPVYAENGEQITQFGVYEYNGKYGSRWYSGFGCGDALSASEIASIARDTAGSSSVYVGRGDGSCVGPLNPTSRNGSL